MNHDLQAMVRWAYDLQKTTDSRTRPCTATDIWREVLLEAHNYNRRKDKRLVLDRVP